MQNVYFRSCLVQLYMNKLYRSYRMRNEEQVTSMFINWVVVRYSESDTQCSCSNILLVEEHVYFNMILKITCYINHHTFISEIWMCTFIQQSIIRFRLYNILQNFVLLLRTKSVLWIKLPITLKWQNFAVGWVKLCLCVLQSWRECSLKLCV